jgi:hypothetical protein
MTLRPPVKIRSVKETLLIVGEGDADIAFVRHVKRTYADSLGRAVQEHNAKGKGGKNVLETALRRANNNNRAYDKVVLLLDIDTDWDDAARAKARRSRVGKRGRLDVIESNPCLEAWLLKILGVETEGDTRHMKREFRMRIGCEAHEPNWMGRLLNRDVLDQARERVSQLADLMNHMGIAKP